MELAHLARGDVNQQRLAVRVGDQERAVHRVDVDDAAGRHGANHFCLAMQQWLDLTAAKADRMANKRHSLSFRPAIIADGPRIAISLREPDRLELEALGTGTVLEIVADSLRRSRWAMLAEDQDGALVAAFGVCDATLIGGHGLPWFLTTDLVRRHPRRALAASRAWVEAMKAEYWTLSGWCHVKHAAAIKHLRWMGFTVGRPQGEFLQFWWRRA